MLACFLLTLLEISEGAQSAKVATPTGVQLCLLPLNDETASEVLRIYLGAMKFAEQHPDSRAVAKLLTSDFAALAPREIVQVLAFLGEMHFSHEEVIDSVEAAQDRIHQRRKEQVRPTRAVSH